MDNAKIPAVFWYTLSFCMLVATLGLLCIAYRSTSVSIEFADLKIEMSSAYQMAKDLRADLEEENKRLNEATVSLDQTYSQVKAAVDAVPAGSPPIDALKRNPALTRAMPSREIRTITPERFQSLDRKLESVQKALATRR